MKSSKHYLKTFSQYRYDSSSSKSGVFNTSSIWIGSILIIIVIIVSMMFDPLNQKDINKVVMIDTETQQITLISKVFKEHKKYINSAYDYGASINGNTITGEMKIRSIEKTESGQYKITSKNFGLPCGDSEDNHTKDCSRRRIVLYIHDISEEEQKEYVKGTKIKFEGKIYSMSKNHIGVERGEIIYD